MASSDITPVDREASRGGSAALRVIVAEDDALLREGIASLLEQAGHEGSTALGKRYADPGTGLELLCVKAGTAALALNGAALPLKSAKPLPASD